MTTKTILPIRRPAVPVLRASLFALMLTLPVAFAPVAAQAHDTPAAHGSESKAAGQTVTTPTGLTVDATWSRATAAGARVAGGYAVLTNKGDKDDVLLSGSTDISEKFEVHEMAVTDGVMRMRKLDAGLAVKAGESVELKPGSYHLMFIGLKRPLREGETFTADLVFREAGTVPVTFDVRGLGARDSGHGHDRGQGDTSKDDAAKDATKH